MALSVKTGNFGSDSTGGGIPPFNRKTVLKLLRSDTTSLRVPLNGLSGPYIITVYREDSNPAAYSNVVQFFTAVLNNVNTSSIPTLTRSNQGTLTQNDQMGVQVTSGTEILLVNYGANFNTDEYTVEILTIN